MEELIAKYLHENPNVLSTFRDIKYTGESLSSFSLEDLEKTNSLDLVDNIAESLAYIMKVTVLRILRKYDLIAEECENIEDHIIMLINMLEAQDKANYGYI